MTAVMGHIGSLKIGYAKRKIMGEVTGRDASAP
jgi:hypothetical protein